MNLKALGRLASWLPTGIKAPRRKVPRAFATILIASTMTLGFFGLAQATAPPGTHLQIQDVSVNFTAKTITILGQQFNFGPGPLMVTLANVGLYSKLHGDAANDHL